MSNQEFLRQASLLVLLCPVPVPLLACQQPGADILVLKHESRKITHFWVVQKFKVLVFSFRLVWAPACRGLTREA